MIFQSDQVITWIYVPRPTLDLVGIVLGALTMAAAVAVLAMVLGSGMGVLLIVRNRRREGRTAPTRLGLLESPHT